ncbi:hypothetical protein L6452_02156 [Arctium lappa]|uniref:Uncharacterized protein n=1 Tax=Arctium lappa TaxID=4217 RepID=A0ACB9FJ18_ARCLA|nr:hypothetical protein L6452_02156 [Arctium lappa]
MARAKRVVSNPTLPGGHLVGASPLQPSTHHHSVNMAISVIPPPQSSSSLQHRQSPVPHRCNFRRQPLREREGERFEGIDFDFEDGQDPGDDVFFPFSAMHTTGYGSLTIFAGQQEETNIQLKAIVGSLQLLGDRLSGLCPPQTRIPVPPHARIPTSTVQPASSSGDPVRQA